MNDGGGVTYTSKIRVSLSVREVVLEVISLSVCVPVTEPEVNTTGKVIDEPGVLVVPSIMVVIAVTVVDPVFVPITKLGLSDVTFTFAASISPIL